MIVISGTKCTLADLAFLRAEGWDIDIRAHVRAGGRVLGICGGYQMLGRSISDPENVESSLDELERLGRLPHSTVFQGGKENHQVLYSHCYPVFYHQPSA